MDKIFFFVFVLFFLYVAIELLCDEWILCFDMEPYMLLIPTQSKHVGSDSSKHSYTPSKLADAGKTKSLDDPMMITVTAFHRGGEDDVGTRRAIVHVSNCKLSCRNGGKTEAITTTAPPPYQTHTNCSYSQ